MGASEWFHAVPYQPDINEALQELRRKVFEGGTYYKPTKWYELLYERGLIDKKRLDEKLKELGSEPEPKSIQELIQVRGHEGTHSIIDIENVSPFPRHRAISPLTSQEMMDLFGTDKPTRDIVVHKKEELQMLRERWQGVYVVIYADGQPSEIFFTGFSGD